MTSEPGNVIRHGFLRDNGGFQFMSKIKPVVKITRHYFDVLFYNVISHTHSPNSYQVFLSSFLLKTYIFKNVCFGYGCV